MSPAEANRSSGRGARAFRSIASSVGGMPARNERRVGDGTAQAGHRDGRGAVALPRPVPGQHLEQDDAERVDVRRRRGRLAAGLLGAEVVDRPERRAGQRHLGLGERPGDPEVGDLDPAVAADQHVARLDVAMDDAARVGRVERPRDLGCRCGPPGAAAAAPLRRRIEARSSPSTSSMTMNGPAGSCAVVVDARRRSGG